MLVHSVGDAGAATHDKTAECPSALYFFGKSLDLNVMMTVMITHRSCLFFLLPRKPYFPLFLCNLPLRVPGTTRPLGVTGPRCLHPKGLTRICPAVFWHAADPSEVRSLRSLKVRHQTTSGKLRRRNKPEMYKRERDVRLLHADDEQIIGLSAAAWWATANLAIYPKAANWWNLRKNPSLSSLSSQHIWNDFVVLPPHIVSEKFPPPSCLISVSLWVTTHQSSATFIRSDQGAISAQIGRRFILGGDLFKFLIWKFCTVADKVQVSEISVGMESIWSQKLRTCPDITKITKFSS